MLQHCDRIKMFIKVFAWFLVWLFLPFHSAMAAARVEPLQLTCGQWILATIPQLQNELPPKQLRGLNAMLRQVVLTAYGQFEQAALETRADSRLPEHLKNALTFRANYEIFRNDRQFVSLGQTVYRFTGGAHGMSSLTATTVRISSGQAIGLADLFLPGSDYRERLDGAVRRVGAARGLPLWGYNGVKENANFYVTDKGLVLFFQPYEIAPYSEGIVKIMVPYQELADIMTLETEQ